MSDRPIPRKANDESSCEATANKRYTVGRLVRTHNRVSGLGKERQGRPFSMRVTITCS